MLQFCARIPNGLSISAGSILARGLLVQHGGNLFYGFPLRFRERCVQEDEEYCQEHGVGYENQLPQLALEW